MDLDPDPGGPKTYGSGSATLVTGAGLTIYMIGEVSWDPKRRRSWASWYSFLSACRALIVRPWPSPFFKPNFHSTYNSVLLRVCVARRQCGATWRMCTRRWRWRCWRRRPAPTSTCLPTCSRAAASYSHSWGSAWLLVSRQFIYHRTYRHPLRLQ